MPTLPAEQRTLVDRAGTLRTGRHDPPKYKPYISVDGSLPIRSVAIATRNPALYADLVAWLREVRVPSISVWPGDRLPSAVAAVLTSPEEVSVIRHPRVLAVVDDSDRTALLAAVRHALALGGSADELIVGIDPGPRPGYAVLAAGLPIAEGNIETPEAVGRFGSLLRRRFPGHPIRYRVGRGDPVARDRIVTALAPLHRPVELIDERGTTPKGKRHSRDAKAARAIAGGTGPVVHGEPRLAVTAGEIANVQRMSRLDSGGMFTISKTVASRVLRGEVSLADAITAEQARYALPPPSPGHRHRARAEPS